MVHTKQIYNLRMSKANVSGKQGSHPQVKTVKTNTVKKMTNDTGLKIKFEALTAGQVRNAAGLPVYISSP